MSKEILKSLNEKLEGITCVESLISVTARQTTDYDKGKYAGRLELLLELIGELSPEKSQQKEEPIRTRSDFRDRVSK